MWASVLNCQLHKEEINIIIGCSRAVSGSRRVLLTCRMGRYRTHGSRSTTRLDCKRVGSSNVSRSWTSLYYCYCRPFERPVSSTPIVVCHIGIGFTCVGCDRRKSSPFLQEEKQDQTECKTQPTSFCFSSKRVTILWNAIQYSIHSLLQHFYNFLLISLILRNILDCYRTLGAYHCHFINLTFFYYR